MARCRAALGQAPTGLLDMDRAISLDPLRDAIERLEPLVSSGGIVYVDDYGSFRGCALAIDEYRTAKGITAPLHPLASGPHNKFQGLWWRKA